MANRRGSSLGKTCDNCELVTAECHPGWRLCSGAYAMLCHRCWSAFQDGTFCQIFHFNESGWTLCERCDKGIHYSCLLSFDHYVATDFGDVICKVCYESDAGAEKQRLSSHATIAKLLQKSYAGPSGTTDAVASSSAEIEAPTTDVPPVPPVHTQAAPKENVARFSGPPGRRRNALVPDASGWVPLHPRFQKNATRSCPPKIESKVLVLEKRLSAKGANPKVGSITVPKKIAETYFCKLSLGQVASVAIKDKDGVDWDLLLSLEPKGSRPIYILEGLGHFISSRQCKAGDKVTLHMVEGSKKFIIGFIDGSA